MSTNLVRTKKDRVVGGVCAGLGQYFDVDPILVRAVFVITTLAGGAGIIAYILLLLIMPEESNDSTETKKETTMETEKSESGSVFARNSKRNALAGIILVTLGLVLLMENLFPQFDTSRFWPLLLIALGVILVARKEKK